MDFCRGFRVGRLKIKGGAPRKKKNRLLVCACLSLLGFWGTVAGIACGGERPMLDLPVFPGAQGFGTETVAGRGGRVIKVTNLDDKGSGSLRAALEADGPRIVVFEVSGNIALHKNLAIKNPYITVAGQTAPSPGIALTGAGLEIRTHDVLVQHLRIRVGDASHGPPPLRRDGCVVYGPDGYNVVLDHMSISWGVDKNTSTWYSVHDITISNSIIAEALASSIHPEGEHSMGSLVGDHGKRISFVGNLWAHNKARNPAMKGDTSTVILNNVMYDAGIWSMYMADDFDHGPSAASVVGNVFIPGPATPEAAKALVVESSVKPGTAIYLSDNFYAGNFFSNKAAFDPRVTSPPVWHHGMIVHDSRDVEALILASAGARPAERDAVDARIIQELQNRSGRVIDSPRQVGGWPNLAQNRRAFPMPSAPAGDADGDGYTNVEEVLQRMAAQVAGGERDMP